ncbi:MAG TPA: GntR family transcriptional regulator [Burkholderiales bacterium]|jgi:DNA-binding GntR family transcriptional regulator
MDLRIQPQSVQSLTIEKLREAIIGGVFKPGQKLVEAELCERLGVSRSSVREALRRLEAERLIRLVPNRGPFVADIDAEEAQQIYHVRAMMEGEACYLYATRADAKGIRTMREALADFDRAVKSGDAVARLSSTARFYEVILEGCGNAVIAEILHGLLARVNFLRARSMSTAGRVRHSAREMREILEAIEAGSARSARAAAVAHVNKASEVALASLREGSGNATEAA